jgi:protein-tyrosine-phosphatase
MAAAILKHRNIDGVEVKSAGIFAADGGDASAHAKQVLKDNKISYQHRSQMLTDAEVDWADLIITMTDAHKRSIQQQYPQAAEKVFTLKEYSGEATNLDITDPYGGDLEQYKKTFHELERLIDQMIEKITAEP